MRRGWLVGLVVLVVILFVFGSYISTKNTLVGKQESVRAANSEIDVDLQRRADLIPNLVQTVKGYAKHEETVFGDIANARAGLLNAQGTQGKLEADGRLQGALGRLLALSENYPDLKSNQNFLALQDQLEGTETGSRWSAAATTLPCRTTTRICGSSQTACGPAWLAFSH